MITTPYNQIVTNDHDTTSYKTDPYSWISDTGAMTTSHVPIEVQSGRGLVLADDSTTLTYDYTTSNGTVWYSTATSPSGRFYTFSATTDMTNMPMYYEGAEIVLAVFFITLTLATIVGNMMALTVFTRIPVSKTVSVIFFTSMAIADLCNGIFVMPFSVYSLLNKDRVLNVLNENGTNFNDSLQNYCTFSGIVMNTSNKAALFTLILICFDRFISVHDALHVHLIMTVKNCLILVVTCWVAALVLAVFPYLIPDRGMMGAEARPYKIKNYEYMPSYTQCSYRVEDMFDWFRIGEYIGVYEFNKYTPEQLAEKDNGFVGEYQLKEGVNFLDIDTQAYPPYVGTAYFFLNILPIVIPTYLIVFFCVAVIVILHRIFKNSKRIIQQIEPPDLKRNRSFRGSVHLTKSLSFKKKAADKPITTQIRQVEAGYTEIHMGQGTASEHLEGQVVLRRTSRKIKEVNINSNRSPNLARDRWSQISVKSLQKRTKADHQKKAINTVILMLMFFVFCYALEWFNIFNGFFVYLGMMKSVLEGVKPVAITYYSTLTTIMKYLNCAGNPFLYYFRMSQFQKEVRGLTQSWNGTTNNKIQTSGSTSRQVSAPSRPHSSHRDSAYRLSDNLSRGSFKHRGSFTSSYKGTPTLRGNSFRKPKDMIVPGPSHLNN